MLYICMFHFWVVNQGFISVALIVVGAFIAGARDLSFDARGYASLCGEHYNSCLSCNYKPYW
jgi:hypothetical protein